MAERYGLTQRDVERLADMSFAETGTIDVDQELASMLVTDAIMARSQQMADRNYGSNLVFAPDDRAKKGGYDQTNVQRTMVADNQFEPLIRGGAHIGGKPGRLDTLKDAPASQRALTAEALLTGAIGAPRSKATDYANPGVMEKRAGKDHWAVELASNGGKLVGTYNNGHVHGQLRNGNVTTVAPSRTSYELGNIGQGTKGKGAAKDQSAIGWVERNMNLDRPATSAAYGALMSTPSERTGRGTREAAALAAALEGLPAAGGNVGGKKGTEGGLAGKATPAEVLSSLQKAIDDGSMPLAYDGAKGKAGRGPGGPVLDPMAGNRGIGAPAVGEMGPYMTPEIAARAYAIEAEEFAARDREAAIARDREAQLANLSNMRAGTGAYADIGPRDLSGGPSGRFSNGTSAAVPSDEGSPFGALEEHTGVPGTAALTDQHYNDLIDSMMDEVDAPGPLTGFDEQYETGGTFGGEDFITGGGFYGRDQVAENINEAVGMPDAPGELTGFGGISPADTERAIDSMVGRPDAPGALQGFDGYETGGTFGSGQFTTGGTFGGAGLNYEGFDVDVSPSAMDLGAMTERAAIANAIERGVPETPRSAPANTTKTETSFDKKGYDAALSAYDKAMESYNAGKAQQAAYDRAQASFGPAGKGGTAAGRNASAGAATATMGAMPTMGAASFALNGMGGFKSSVMDKAIAAANTPAAPSRPAGNRPSVGPAPTAPSRASFTTSRQVSVPAAAGPRPAAAGVRAAAAPTVGFGTGGYASLQAPSRLAASDRVNAFFDEGSRPGFGSRTASGLTTPVDTRDTREFNSVVQAQGGWSQPSDNTNVASGVLGMTPGQTYDHNVGGGSDIQTGNPGGTSSFGTQFDSLGISMAHDGSMGSLQEAQAFADSQSGGGNMGGGGTFSGGGFSGGSYDNFSGSNWSGPG